MAELPALNYFQCWQSRNPKWAKKRSKDKKNVICFHCLWLYTSSRRKKKADRAGCQELCPASRHRWGLAKTWQQEGLRIIFSFNINSGHIKENPGSKNKGVKCLTHPQHKVRGSWAFWKELEVQETRSTLWSAPRHMWQFTTLGRLEYQSSLKKTAWIPPSLPSWIADKTVADRKSVV